MLLMEMVLLREHLLRGPQPVVCNGHFEAQLLLGWKLSSCGSLWSIRSVLVYEYQFLSQDLSLLEARFVVQFLRFNLVLKSCWFLR